MKKYYIYYILIVSFFLRLMAINQSFWLDEATTATVARSVSWADYFNKFIPGDFHPPLYYVLSKAWGIIFGVNEPSLRILSVIFALASIYLVYKITQIVADETAALLAALLLSLAPLHIYYSQEARMYSLTMALSALLIYTYLLFKKSPSWGNKKLLVGSIVALVYTNYLSLLMIIPILLDFYNSKKSKKFILGAVQISLVSVLIIAPLFYLVTLPQVGGFGGAIDSNWATTLGKFSLKNIALIPVKFIIGRINFSSNIVYGTFVLLPLSVYTYLIYQLKPSKQKLSLIFYWLGTPLILGMVLSLFIPILTYFRFIFVLPALYILLAIGLTRLKDDYFLPILLVVLVFNLYFSYRFLNNPKFYREDWRGLITYIHSVDEDPTVVFPSQSQQEAFKYYSDLPISKASDVRENEERVWLLRYAYDISDPADTTRQQIEDLGYKIIDQKDFNGVVVWEYKK